MKLSIISTLYQSAPHIHEFHKRISKAAFELVEDDYEIILVNDGSPDNSLDLAIKLTEIDSHVILIDLSRNFGHHKAIMNGLAYAKGDKIYLTDSDLEEDPEWLLSFNKQMIEQECDVVYGVQVSRKGDFFERITGQWFYRIFRFLTELHIPDNIVMARLMTQRYVKALLQHKEKEVFLAGLFYITGFLQCYQVVKKHSSSETTYTLRRKISMLVNSITSFSNAPLIMIFYIGILISLFSVFYIIYLVSNWLFLAEPLTGWTSVMASIWLLGGMIISFIGVVGIYLSKIFSEIKNRPNTIVRRVYFKQ